MLKGAENYETLKEGLAPVLADIQEVIEAGYIELDGRPLELQFYLGGDYKFLLLMMGMNQAHSNHVCLFCTVHKNKRWMTTSPADKRTLATMEQCRQHLPGSKERLGCIEEPLVGVEIDMIAIDTLHLMLRVHDVLLRNLINAMIHKDQVASHSGAATTAQLDKLVSAIQSCGLTFRVWKDREGKGSDCYKWTSLRGRDRRIMFKRLPPVLSDLFDDPSDGPVVEYLWKEFDNLLSLFPIESPSEAVLKDVCEGTVDWIEKFLSLTTLEGHKRANVTPYIHIMVMHMPDQMRSLGGLLRFSGQGVKKNNDDARRNFLSSNRWDAPKEVLLAEHRLDLLSRFTRKKRQYTKRPREDYSASDILQPVVHGVASLAINEIGSWLPNVDHNNYCIIIYVLSHCKVHTIT